MLWRVSSRPVRSRLKPAGFILPCQPALADRPPSGPGWLHEINLDGYGVIARKQNPRQQPKHESEGGWKAGFGANSYRYFPALAKLKQGTRYLALTLSFR